MIHDTKAMGYLAFYFFYTLFLFFLNIFDKSYQFSHFIFLVRPVSNYLVFIQSKLSYF